MIETRITDHVGLEHVVRTAEDLNRIIAVFDQRRDELAELMLGADRGAAIAAERQSDQLEDVFLPKFQAEVARVQALLEDAADDADRHAKAHAIKDRARGMPA